MRLLSAVLALALAAALAHGPALAAPEGTPELPAATRAVLAGGIDSLGRAHVAATATTKAVAPELLSSVPVDVSAAALAARLAGTVTVRARVSTLGLVDSVRVVSGDPRLRDGVVASVRWWIFQPPARPTWTTLAVKVDGRDDPGPLNPDVLAMARDAERRGAPWESIDAIVGALGRVGRHPRIQNEWALRAQAIRLARRVPDRVHVPGALMSGCQNARGRQARTLARSDHQDMVAVFDQALLVAPWWADGYQWRAASLLQCGRGIDAMRSLVLFRAAAEDAAARSLADRALARLATGDTLGVAQLLVHEGKQFNLDEDADH